MVKVLWTQKFEQDFKKIRDSSTKKRILKQIKKIADRPEKGKPLRFSFKGERTLYIKPYRLIYSFTSNILVLLRFEYKKKSTSN